VRRISPFILVLSLSLTFCSPSQQPSVVSEQPAISDQPQLSGSLFEHYIASQQALAADNYNQAQLALQQLAGETTGEVKALAEEATKAEDIESLRIAFKSLSEEIIKMTLPEGYVVAFCPMADQNQGAHWAQKDGEIRNPYLGSAMLTCGSFIE
jgi:hypothetical protein